MNHKQWTLLIIMSTMLILSAVTIIMLLLSDTNITESEPPPIEQKIMEFEDSGNSDPEGGYLPENNPEDQGNRESSTPADSSGTVNEWFEQEHEIQAEQEKNLDDHIDKGRTQEKSDVNSEIQMPEDPEEPEIQFEDQN